MALLSKKEFAAKANKSTRELAVYTHPSRRKVIVDAESGMIDPMHPTNKAFLAKFGGVQEPKVAKVVQAVSDVVTVADEDDDGLMSMEESDKMKNHFSALRNQKAVELAELEISKKMGLVIPSEFIKPLFAQHNQSILTEFKNLMDDAIRVVSKECDLNVEQVASIKGKWISGLNEAMERAKLATKKGIESIVDNYIEAKK